MADEPVTIVEISVSRIIHAKLWRVIRMVTKVWQFPSFMPNVKEATVIHKSHNKITTKWKIQVDTVPINWVQEELLVLHHNAIYFKAIEGDLEDFEGEWIFKEQDNDTLVTVNVALKVGIPVIKEFAGEYLKKLLTKNFEAMLEALEKRLISLKYVGLKEGKSEKIAGFGIIGHPYDFAHLDKCFKMINPDFSTPSPEFISHLFHVSPSFKLYDINEFKSKTGDVTNGCFIIATFIPDMMEKDMWTVFSKVVRACKIAEKHGIGIVTLGGFTSIVAEKIGHEVSQEVDIAVTSGNTFTAAMALEGVTKAAALLDVDMAVAKVAIIGGTGDIGSGCARVLAKKVRKLIITGRTKANLARFSAELRKLKGAKIIATTDNQQAVEDADIVIAVASATKPILEMDWFKPGAIVCDVGYPKNISHAPTKREDILVFSGGMAKTPTPVNFPIDLALPSAAVVYGCFAEGIILALERRFENYSFGRGNITPEKINEITLLGSKHGFEVSDFYWGDTLVDEPFIERVKHIIHENKAHRPGKKTAVG